MTFSNPETLWDFNCVMRNEVHTKSPTLLSLKHHIIIIITTPSVLFFFLVFLQTCQSDTLLTFSHFIFSLITAVITGGTFLSSRLNPQ